MLDAAAALRAAGIQFSRAAPAPPSRRRRRERSKGMAFGRDCMRHMLAPFKLVGNIIQMAKDVMAFV
jgi:hypothetical protein